MVVFVVMEEKEVYNDYCDVDHVADIVNVYISRELAERNLRDEGWIKQVDGIWNGTWNNDDMSAIRWISEQTVIGA